MKSKAGGSNLISTGLSSCSVGPYPIIGLMFGEETAKSVPKVSDSCESHRHIALIGGRDHFRIAERAAGLNGRRCARVGGRDQAVRKREKSIAANDASLE